MSQLVFRMCWNPEEEGSNVNEGMVLLARQGKADKEKTLLILCPKGFQ